MEEHIIWVSDILADDSDKTFTVPAGDVWEIKLISASLVATATVGNRTLDVVISDGTNTLYTFKSGINQAASATRYYLLSPEMPNLSSMRNTNYDLLNLPVLFLVAGSTIRVYDSAAVAAAADDMKVFIHAINHSKVPA